MQLLVCVGSVKDLLSWVEGLNRMQPPSKLWRPAGESLSPAAPLPPGMCQAKAFDAQHGNIEDIVGLKPAAIALLSSSSLLQATACRHGQEHTLQLTTGRTACACNSRLAARFSFTCQLCLQHIMV